jgi:2-octaprenyl-6-methoxyphenol hydroxylase
MKAQYDLIIVGGGAVGALLALALKNTDIQVLLIEKQEQSLFAASERSLILSPATKKYFEQIGVWSLLQKYVTPIHEVQVSMQHHFGGTRFSATQQQLPSLGYAISLPTLLKALYQGLFSATNIDVVLGTEPISLTQTPISWHLTLRGKLNKVSSASLLVAADGGKFIPQRLGIARYQYDYNHVAVTCSVNLDSHKNIAYERFTETGAIAILPFTGSQKATLVWSLDAKEAYQLASLRDQDFIQVLQEAFGYRCGKINGISPRLSIPLKMELAEKQVSERAVLLGNSAHLLHPVAAQGFNLSVRDVMALSEKLKKAKEAKEDLGNYALLHDYVRARLDDQHAVIAGTDFLARYLANRALAPSLRAMALILTELVPSMKQSVARMGLGLKMDPVKELV